ncbi:MAG TPA: glycosyltransferase [Devosia sp.]|uniref:glycosyltransferase family 4 protein n=1 Tax=Devosia sp. TaxID=1871048 RepID=UPI002F9541B7
MRILQVMRAPVGGLFRHVADLTRELSKRGHCVGLVVDSLAGDAQTQVRLAELESHATLGIHRMPMPRLLGSGDLATPFAIASLGRKLSVDVMHGHGAKGGFYARLARFGGGKAVAVYTPHGGVLHFSKTSPSGRIFHRLERTLVRQTGAIIFESAYAQVTYSTLITRPDCPTEVIYNGLAPEEFDPVQQHPDAADFAFVGELRALKGIHVLVDALKDVRRPDGAPATLAMAGDGPSRTELEAQITRLGLADRITLLGSLPARTAFATGRIAVVPSLAESLPYVVMEAAAAQLPVIATNVGGIPEIFADTQDSLVPPDDVPALQNAMQKALTDPKPMQHEMQRRLARIADQFSVTAMANRIEALYHALLARA